MQKAIKIICLLLLPFLGVAQGDEQSREAKAQVLEALTSTPTGSKAELAADLERGAWEAISYIEEKDKPTTEDLKEAVGDYYRFVEDLLYLKLVDPEDKNSFGMEMKLPYRLNANGRIDLFDARTGLVKNSWQILYLDGSYLALDLGDLRVFFVHTPVKE